MLSSVSSQFFLGANTPDGFYSMFDQLYSPEDGWRLYIIKGGPGTGKSTLMKKIAAECDRRGIYCERIYCSSDPSSLDAVIIESLKVSIADGTPPHTLEPRYPGVSEITVDLGRFRDDKRLRDCASEVIRISNTNSYCHKKCVDFLSAAKAVDNDTSSVVIASMKMERLHKFAEKLSQSKLKSQFSTPAVMKKRFLSALTPEGLVMFRDTFTGLCDNIVVLKDSFGCASSALLKIISMTAARQGISGIMCSCPMSPRFRPEHFIIPEMGIGFFTSNRHHPDEFDEYSSVDCMRFYDESLLSRHKNRIAFNRRSRDELINEAVNKLSDAKMTHDSLEAFYIDAMDFDAMNEYAESVIADIFS